MKSSAFLTLAIVALLTTAESRVASAQFGTLFGGTKVETIETSQLQKLIEQQREAETKARQAGTELPAPNFVVVDVRTDAEVKVSVIPGAITKAQFEKNKKRYEGSLVIPYCTVGGRSGAYAKQLANASVKVKNYQGSILKWIEAGLPLETLERKATNRVHTYSDRYSVPANYVRVLE